MKAVAPVGTAIVGAVAAADLVFAVLGVECFEVEYGVVVGHAFDGLGVVNFVLAVEADAEGAGAFEGLEHVHIVGHGRRLGLLPGKVVIPTGPGQFFARQEFGISVQHGFVGLVAQCAENLALGGRRVV